MSFAKSLPAAVREIRLHLCQTSPASQGVRQFISSAYAGIKTARPDLKFMIREAQGVEPRAFVRFERGAESQTSLANLSMMDVDEALDRLVKSQTPGA